MNRKSANWVKQIFSPLRKKNNRRKNTVRLHVEGLDQRIVPAIFTVTANDAASLRAAITGANNDDGKGTGGAVQTIQIPTGTYALTGAPGDNANLTGDLDIDNLNAGVALKTYVIQGTGATPGDVVIDANDVDRIFQILGSDVVVKFSNLTIIDGTAVDDGTAAAVPGAVPALGGGVLNSGGGDVFFTNVVVQSNLAGGVAALDGSAGSSPATAGKAGGNGTNGQAAFGGGVYSVGGTITLTGAGTKFFQNDASGGDGGAGGAGAANNVAGKVGGAGGNGGVGGDAAGGALYAEGGSVVVLAGVVFQSNSVSAGTGGNGGAGGGNNQANGIGGAGGKGGVGGKGSGGAIFVNTGKVSVTGGQFINNQVTDNDGGDGGAGGAATGVAGRGGAGGAGAVGGVSLGGAIAILSGDVTVGGAALFQGNSASGGEAGSGGDGGAGDNTAGIGGAGGSGAAGSDALGGAIYAGNGAVVIDGGSIIDNNLALGGSGSSGGNGGAGNIGGNGGDGAAGGDGLGGGIYVETGSVSILGGSKVTNNDAEGSSGSQGGNGGQGSAGGVGGNGGIGGDGGDAFGGGIAIAAGNVTIDGGSLIQSNSADAASASSGGNGGVGTGAAGKGGNGGKGGVGGDAFGGGIWAGKGTVTVTGASIIDDNNAFGSSGSVGGAGGAGGAAGAGGAGGDGGAGGVGAGGGIYVETGAVVLSGGALVTSNSASGDSGGNGGVGGQGGKLGGAGGAGAAGGDAFGGGIAVASGDVTVSGAVTIQNNNVEGSSGGNGGNGGAGTAGTGVGGNAGKGGDGGTGQGGGIWVLSGTVTLSGGAVVDDNTASGSNGGNGGVGGDGGGKEGAGGNGGNGGNGEGGGIWVGSGALNISGGSLITSNLASASNGGAGGNRGGTAVGTAANGSGGKGGSGLGGGIYAGAASVTITGFSQVSENSAYGDNGGNAAAGVAGGPAGSGGDGGSGEGGGIFALTGDVTLTSAQVLGNSVSGSSGGDGGANGTGLGKGGNGGNSAGGGIAVLGGTLTLDTVHVEDNSAYATTADGGAAGAGGQGGNGGSVLGGGIYVAATAKALDITDSSVFDNLAYNAGDGAGGGKGGNVFGGGIYAAAPVVEIDNTTIALNEATGPGTGTPDGTAEGGGVYLASTGAKVHNSTVVYNIADTTGDGIRNKGTLEIISTIVGRNDSTALGSNAVNTGNGIDINNTGGTITGSNNLIENGLGSGLTDGTNNNIVGKSFLNPTFNQTAPVAGKASQNTVFVDSDGSNGAANIGAPQTASNGTLYFRLVTPAEFSAASLANPQGKLPAGAISALDLGANPDGLVTDQIGNPRTQGTQTDIGAIEGNGQVVATSGAKVVSAVFSGTAANTFDKITVTFDQPIQSGTYGAGDITLTGPGGAPITVTSITPATPGSTTTFVLSFATQTAPGTYNLVQGVDILNVGGGFQMNQNGNSVNGELPPTSPDDLFRTSATLAGTPATAPTYAVGGANGFVRLLGADGTLISNFQAITGYTGLVSVALGDFNKDGTQDVAVAATQPSGVAGLPASAAGKVFVYDGAALAKGTVTLLHTFTPFANSNGPAGTTGAYINGLNIAAGDIDGDGNVDLVAGSRGGTATTGKVEYGRLIVVSQGAAADGSQDTIVGSNAQGFFPFGTAYQKGVVVSVGDTDGTPGDEIGVTRGGPVNSPSATVQQIKVKLVQLSGSALSEIDLTGAGLNADGTTKTPFAPYAGLTAGTINRDARVAFVDQDGDGKDSLVFSAIDPFSTPGSNTIRISAYDVVASGTSTKASPVSTGTGVNGSYTVGSGVSVSFDTTGVTATAPASNLALISSTGASGSVQVLNALTGATLAGGFSLAIPTGGVTIDAI